MATTPTVRVVQVVDLTGISGSDDAWRRVQRIRPGVRLRVILDRSAWRTNGLSHLLAGQAFRATEIDLEAEDPRVASDFLELLRPHLAAMRTDWEQMQTPAVTKEAS